MDSTRYEQFIPEIRSYSMYELFETHLELDDVITSLIRSPVTSSSIDDLTWCIHIQSLILNRILLLDNTDQDEKKTQSFF